MLTANTLFNVCKLQRLPPRMPPPPAEPPRLPPPKEPPPKEPPPKEPRDPLPNVADGADCWKPLLLNVDVPWRRVPTVICELELP